MTCGLRPIGGASIGTKYPMQTSKYTTDYTRIEYSKEFEDVTIDEDTTQSQSIERLVAIAQVLGRILETRQFAVPSGYRLTQLRSSLQAPAYKYGTHEEHYERLGALTTTSTTTSTTT